MAKPVIETFDAQTVRRLMNMLRAWERLPRNTITPATGPRRSSGGDTIAVLNSNLANATSATAPTNAMATLRQFASGTFSAGTRVLKVWNYHNKTFASGDLVYLGFALGAWFVIDARDCPT